MVSKDYLWLWKRRGATCCVDVKIGGLIGDVAGSFQAWAFRSDFTGISLGLVDIHLEWALGEEEYLNKEEDLDVRGGISEERHEWGEANHVDNLGKKNSG